MDDQAPGMARTIALASILHRAIISVVEIRRYHSLTWVRFKSEVWVCPQVPERNAQKLLVGPSRRFSNFSACASRLGVHFSTAYDVDAVRKLVNECNSDVSTSNADNTQA